MLLATLYVIYCIGVLVNLLSDILCPECCDKTLYTETEGRGKPHIMIKCACGYPRAKYLM